MGKTVLVFLFFFLISASADSQAIKFQPLSWQNALAKAKQENKMIFVEVYTTWCTYCRQMEQSVFPAAEAGSFYNDHFINVRYDALKWDGIQIRKSYALGGFPALLYLDNNGLVIKKTTGYEDADTFIKNGNTAVTLLQNK